MLFFKRSVTDSRRKDVVPQLTHTQLHSRLFVDLIDVRCRQLGLYHQLMANQSSHTSWALTLRRSERSFHELWLGRPTEPP